MGLQRTRRCFSNESVALPGSMLPSPFQDCQVKNLGFKTQPFDNCLFLFIKQSHCSWSSTWPWQYLETLGLHAELTAPEWHHRNRTLRHFICDRGIHVWKVRIHVWKAADCFSHGLLPKNHFSHRRRLRRAFSSFGAVPAKSNRSSNHREARGPFESGFSIKVRANIEQLPCIFDGLISFDNYVPHFTLSFSTSLATISLYRWPSFKTDSHA